MNCFTADSPHLCITGHVIDPQLKFLHKGPDLLLVHHGIMSASLSQIACGMQKGLYGAAKIHPKESMQHRAIDTLLSTPFSPAVINSFPSKGLHAGDASDHTQQFQNLCAMSQ